MTPSKVKRRLERQRTAWSQLANEEQFAGMTLADLDGHLQRIEASLDREIAAEAALEAVRKDRDKSLTEAMRDSKRLAMAMKSHPKFGEDSALVKASGFVTESDRRSGLTRKNAEKGGVTNDVTAKQ